jgi:hypothetical protein
MIMRRRRLLRAAAVGGGAYVMGKRAASRRAQQEQAWASQDTRISDLEGQQATASALTAQPAAGPAAEAEMFMSDQLIRLADLHSQGVLSDGEFAAAKAKLLGI